MATGAVKRLVKDRGFGFIRRDDVPKGSPDVFFHRSAVQAEPGFSFDTINEGDRVEFDVGDGPKGLRAENITRE